MDHKVYEHQLKGGGRGLVIHVPGSRVVKLEIVFNSGYIFADPAKFEVPHIMEHMMYRESERFPDRFGYSMTVEENGAGSNAATDSYNNLYWVECAAEEHERIIDLFMPQLAGALFTQDVLASEIGNVRQELTRNTTQYEKANTNKLFSVLRPASSKQYAERIAQLDSINRQDILDHYRKFYSRQNLTFFVAGDFVDGGKTVVQQIQAGVDLLPMGTKFSVSEDVPEPVSTPILTHAPIKQLHYMASTSFGKIANRQKMASKLLSQLLTGGWSSWVRQVVRREGLAYGVGSGSSSSYGYDGFSFWNNVTPNNAKAVFKVYADMLGRAKSGDFSQDDVDHAAHMLHGLIIRTHQSPASFIGWHETHYLLTGTIDELDQYLDDLMTITKEEVVEVARIVSARPWSLALTGDITQAEADELHQTLAPIWQNS